MNNNVMGCFDILCFMVIPGALLGGIVGLAKKGLYRGIAGAILGGLFGATFGMAFLFIAIHPWRFIEHFILPKCSLESNGSQCTPSLEILALGFIFLFVFLLIPIVIGSLIGEYIGGELLEHIKKRSKALQDRTS
jgi:hypothetical protein